MGDGRWGGRARDGGPGSGPSPGGGGQQKASKTGGFNKAHMEARAKEEAKYPTPTAQKPNDIVGYLSRGSKPPTGSKEYQDRKYDKNWK